MKYCEFSNEIIKSKETITLHSICHFITDAANNHYANNIFQGFNLSDFVRLGLAL